MEAEIKKVENGYILRLVDLRQGMIGLNTKEYVFGDGDLKGVFKKIDRFFLGSEEPGEEK